MEEIKISIYDTETDVEYIKSVKEAEEFLNVFPGELLRWLKEPGSSGADGKFVVTRKDKQII